MLDKNSYGSVILVFALGLALLALVGITTESNALLLITAIPVLFCCWFIVNFFRVPKRAPAGDDRTVTSAADGKVVFIGEVYEGEFLKRECRMISIYMNFFDVHANFWPVTGEVTYYRYHPGKHFLAFKPKASEENEHTCTSIRANGGDVFFKQLAGGFARRIVCYSKPGLQVEAGRQCGIIKFGSRMDIFVPLDAEICVTLNQKVVAAETVVANLR